jgi:SOS response regulatory protein OraA/RecX
MQSDERAGDICRASRAGVTRLRLELIRRGLPGFDRHTFCGRNGRARAREVLELKLRGKERPREWKERQKLAAFLARRGFSLDVVRRVIDE